MRVFTVIGHIFGYSLFGSNGKTKVFKHRRKSKQKTNRSDSSGAVRRLGTIIQRIFLCPITSWYLSNHLEMVWRHSLPKGVSISAWNFHRAVSHDPTDSPWTFEDVTRPPLTSSFKNGEVIWVIRISSGPTAARVARNWVNKSISKTQTSFHILHAVIYVRNKEQKQKQRNSEIYFGMNNSYVEKGCLPFDRKIRLGCPKQIKKYQNRYFLFMRVKYKEEANLWGGSLEPIQLVNGLVSVVQAPSSWYLGSKMVMSALLSRSCESYFPSPCFPYYLLRAWHRLDCNIVRIFAYSSTREQSNLIWSEAENGERNWDLRYAKSMLRKKIPTVLQARSTG